MATNIYLAKKGKITGPLSNSDYENLRLSGQIEDFFWIWHDEMKQWIPLDPPPPPIQSFGEVTATRLEAKTTRAPEPVHPATIAAQAAAATVIPIKPTIKFGSMESIEVLVHNFRDIVQGSIQEPTQLGFTLMTVADKHAPKLGSQGKVVLNLLNKKNGEMVTVPGEITGVVRAGDGWSYQVRWNDLPAHFFK